MPRNMLEGGIWKCLLGCLRVALVGVSDERHLSLVEIEIRVDKATPRRDASHLQQPKGSNAAETASKRWQAGGQELLKLLMMQLVGKPQT